MRNGSKVLVHTIAAVSVLSIASGASAAHFKAGLWHGTGYHEDPDGTRTNCNATDCATPFKSTDPEEQARYDKFEEGRHYICAPTDSLQAFANDQLAKYPEIFGRFAHIA